MSDFLISTLAGGQNQDGELTRKSGVREMGKTVLHSFAEKIKGFPGNSETGFFCVVKKQFPAPFAKIPHSGGISALPVFSETAGKIFFDIFHICLK